MTAIYLAGKIAKNDWRHDLVPLRSAWGSDGVEPGPWPVLTGAVAGMDYVGPYFMGDDHGCGHGESTHGCGEDGGVCGGAYPAPHRPQVRDLCLNAIRKADIVFAWLDDPTAYGTLVEIGYAYALGKTLVIAAPQLPSGPNRMHGTTNRNDADDLWFAFSLATYAVQASNPAAALGQLARLYPRLESPIEEAFWAEYCRGGLRGPLGGLTAQHVVLDGRYRLDFALPTDKIGIELDGYEYHSSREAFTRDRERQRNLEAAGWRIIRFSGAEVHADAQGCVAQAARLVTVIRRDAALARRALGGAR